jgi:amino acid adenylation domain-containing protein
MSTPPRIKEIAALTPLQRGMLHHALLDPGLGAHHEQLVLAFEGELEASRLERAWQHVVDRHDALRGRFLSQRVSSPVHVIPFHEPVALAQHTVARPGDSGGADGLPLELEAFLQADLAQPFELESTHALRLALFSAGTGRHWLVWSFHHILLDGWSIGLVLKEVLAVYAGQPLAPAVDPAAYRRWLAACNRESALQYWQTQLAGLDAQPLVPACADPLPPRPPPRSTVATTAAATTDAAVADRLRALARSRQASLHHVLLCAWGLTVGRFTDQRDVLVPTVVAGRPAEVADVDAMVGLFINNLPMRVRWQAGDTFDTLLQRMRDAAIDATGHQHLSLAEIQARTGALPIDHVFLVQGLPHDDLLGQPCGAARVSAACFRENIPYTLQVSVTPGDHGIGISVQGRHEAAWLQQLADGMLAILLEAAANPDAPLAAIAAATAAQRATVLAWGDGGSALEQRSLLQALDARLALHPDAPALVCDSARLTYLELHAWADRLASTLLARTCLAPETPIGLISHRDAGLLVGMLAILRAGGCFVPIDPQYPPERIRLMLDASGCRTVLVSPGLTGVLPPGCTAQVLHIDDAQAALPQSPPLLAVAPERLAYVIFTSGSTGTPKGVMVSHWNAASLLAAIPHATGLGDHERVLGSTTVSFDISVLELLGPLTWGGTLVLASAVQAKDPALLLELIEREQVTLLQGTPTRLQLLLDAAPTDPQRRSRTFSSVRHVLVGGEALPSALAQELLAMPGLRACNVYGPTETAIWSACWPLAPGPVRIGRAFAGERLLVLSQDRGLQPPGAVGEIAIAGCGVGRGYCNDPARTAERFVDVPGVAGKVYLTGDLGCWCGDGSLEFRGRRDEQVKVRGMRIELADVEHQLRQLPGVKTAAASTRRNARGEIELLAYLTGPATVEPAALRAQLASLLPDAMVPGHFVLLDALPQTPAGKTDRRALPAPPAAAAVQPHRAARNETEAAITAVFSDVLGRPVGPDSDFFLSGGQSLLAIQAIGRINRALSCGYALRDLYRAPSAGALAALPVRSSLPLQREPAASDHPLTSQQQALWVLQQLEPDYAGYNVPGAYAVTGPLDLDALTRAWAAVTARHGALRTTFVRIDGLPRQKVHDSIDFRVESHVLAAGTDPAALVREITCRPFDLAQGPLFRLAHIALGADHGVLVLVTHHIVSDGWADAILARDLGIAWQAAVQGRDPRAALPAEPAIRYTDYARWQQRYLASPPGRSHREFWTSRLQDLPLLQLPASGKRSAGLARQGARVEFRLDAPQAEKWLAAVPAGERYAALAAATLALLQLESGQSDLVLGLPVANRERPELQEQAGLHINMLPLRMQLRGEIRLDELRRQCADAIVEALAHADYPFATLVEELGLSAAPGRHPVFDAMLIFHQQPVPVPTLAGVGLAHFDPRSYASRFDLDVEVWADGGAVHGFIEYDSGLFSPQQAHGFAGRWTQLLLCGSRTPAMKLAQLRDGTPGNQEASGFLAGAMALDEEF